MQINLSKFVGFLTGVAAVGLLGFFGYFMYLVFFIGQTPDPEPLAANINPSLFGAKTQKAAAFAKDKKIFLAKTNLSFTESALFKSFTEVPEPVLPTDIRGRDDPFVPYVAP